MRVGLVRSRTDDVTLTADREHPRRRPGRCRRRAAPTRRTSRATRSTLTAHAAARSAPRPTSSRRTSTTRICDRPAARRDRGSSAPTSGRSRATCASALVWRRSQTGNPGTTDAALVAENGSILDGDATTPTPTWSRTASTSRPAGSIGMLEQRPRDQLRRRTRPPCGGRLFAEAILDVAITETRHELTVLGALSRDGNVRLTVPDTNTARGPPLPPAPTQTETPVAPHDQQPQDLILMPTGTKLVAQNDPQDTSVDRRDAQTAAASGRRTTSRSGSATTSTRPANTAIVAGGTIYIHGDANRDAASVDTAEPRPARRRLPTTTPTTDWGTTMFFAGRVGGVFDLDGSGDDTEQTLIFGHVDRDLFTFDHTFLGAHDPRLRQPEHVARRGRGRGSASGRGRRGPLPRRPPADDGGQADDVRRHRRHADARRPGRDRHLHVNDVGQQRDAHATTSSTCSTPAPRTTASTCSTSTASTAR